MWLRGFFILLAWIGLTNLTWAQNACPRDFSDITTSCISSVNKPYSSKPIALTTEIKGNIFFYKTASGDFGKLKVLSVLNTKYECTLFLDAVTFGANEVYIPNSSITISADKSNWLRNKIFLDSQGVSSLELNRTNKGCALSLSKDTEYAFYKKISEERVWESSDLLFYGPLGLIFIAIFIIVRGFLEEQDKFKTQEALEEAENASKAKNEQLFLKVTKPFYKRYFLPLVQGSQNKQKLKNRYRQKLANAGLKDMSPEEFVALKFFMIIGGPFVFLTVRWIMEETWPLALIPVMGVVGYFYPNIWLSGLIKKRSNDVLMAMPFIVDMLALSVEAGLDFMAAISRVIEKAPFSPLVEEFETLIKETKIGSTRAEGLRQLSWRVNMIEINSFCATLIAADSVGASIAPILKQLSNELRVKRSSRAEQLGATAATKILIPMIFFILPAVLVAIFAPMVLKMISGGGP